MQPDTENGFTGHRFGVREARFIELLLSYLGQSDGMDISGAYVDLLQAIVDLTGFGRPLLHVHCGLLIYVVSQVILADRRASVLGFAWVAFFAIMNEVVEAIHYQSPRWGDTLGDLALTMFWPAVIVVLGRYRRYRWSKARPELPAKAPGRRVVPPRGLA